jgi:hypothetical protein
MALSSPPRPGVEANLQVVARSYAWVPVGGSDFGRIERHTLTVESAGADRVRWVAEQGDKLSQDCFAPRLMTKDAYTALREGQLQQDGSLSWQDHRWALWDAWDGVRLIAKLEQL